MILNSNSGQNFEHFSVFQKLKFSVAYRRFLTFHVIKLAEL